MIPYKWPVATAIPQNPQVRLEIAKALRTLVNDPEGAACRRSSEIAAIRNDLDTVRRAVAALRRDASTLVRSELRKYGYNEAEPRIPKHHPGGGEWTRVAAAESPNDATELPFPQQPYGEGHHWVPTVVYANKKYSFREDTKAVFDESTSGALADRTVNYRTKEHIAYEQAVDELLDVFLKDKSITSDQMTPAQAAEFIQEVRGSSDPRIAPFVRKIEQERWRYIRRYGPLRGGGRGGGDEE